VPPQRAGSTPARPGGPTPQAEIQRRYRQRLAAVGKVVRLIDPSAVPIISDFNPGTDVVVDRAGWEDVHERLRNALSKIALLEDDRARWQTDRARAEAELRLEQQSHTKTLKDKIVLKNEIAALKQKARRQTRKRGTEQRVIENGLKFGGLWFGR
jgi:hypothetical protein